MSTTLLAQTNDLRVLDYDGQRVFRNVTISRLGQPVYHKPQPPDYVGELHLDRKEAIMPETHNDVIRDKHCAEGR